MVVGMLLVQFIMQHVLQLVADGRRTEKSPNIGDASSAFLLPCALFGLMPLIARSRTAERPRTIKTTEPPITTL